MCKTLNKKSIHVSGGQVPLITSEPLWVDGPQASPIHQPSKKAEKSKNGAMEEKNEMDLDPLKRAMIQVLYVIELLIFRRLNDVLFT